MLKQSINRILPTLVYKFMHSTLIKVKKSYNKYGYSLLKGVARNDTISKLYFKARREVLSSKFIKSMQSPNVEIANGPFAGIRYQFRNNLWFETQHVWLLKLYGLYEREILDAITQRKWSLLFDLGAGHGYYSIGLLGTGNCEFAVMYEMQQELRELARLNAKSNSIDDSMFLLRGMVSPSEILEIYDSYANSSRFSPLLICDIEGYESVLFQKNFVEGLRDRGFTLIIEIHEHLFWRFQSNAEFLGILSIYFDCQPLMSMRRDLTGLLNWAPSHSDRWNFVSEERGESTQLICKPKLEL